MEPTNCVCLQGWVGSCLLSCATAIDLLFLVVFSRLSGQKVNWRNHKLQAVIYFTYFKDFQF